MKLKYVVLLIIALAASVVLMACTEIEALPEAMKLEDSIKEIITSKGEDYDFTNDELYIDKMEEFVAILVENDLIKEEHFALGNLDDNNIPELVVFRERNPEDQDDEGNLEVYKFNGEKYQLLDSVSMNYDNTSYEIIIGNLAKGQKGIYINNFVGAHSSITYGFVLREDKLVSILNEKKLNLISPYTGNKIQDIDSDGILEFSVPIVDPEVMDPYDPDADRIILWYKWDGQDGGLLTKVERVKGPNSNDDRISNKEILNKAKNLLKEKSYDDFLNYMSENKTQLSLKDNSELLNKYITILSKSSSISDIEEPKDLGLMLKTLEGMDEYIIDYQRFLDIFGDDILKEYKDYLKILALNSNEPYMVDGSLTLSHDKLAERIVLLENYKMTYPYSHYYNKMDKLYRQYIERFVLGGLNNPNFDWETYKVYGEILENFKNIEEKYPHTYFADIISNLLTELKLNENIFSEEIIKKYTSF